MQIRPPFHKLSEHVQTFNLVDKALDDCEITVRQDRPLLLRTMNALDDLEWMEASSSNKTENGQSKIK